MSWLASSLANKFLAWLTNLRVAAAFLAGLTLAIYFGQGLYAYSAALGDMLQLLEPYIYITSSTKEFCALTLGGLLLLSDAPFLTPLSPGEMLRIGRKRWVTGQICYVFLASFLYYLALAVFSALAAGVSCGAYLLGGWSGPVELLAFTDGAGGRYSVSFSFPDMVQAVGPLAAGAESLILQTLYLSFLSLIILGVNLYSQRNLGWLVGSTVHLLGYMVSQNIGFSMPAAWSLLCYVIPRYSYSGSLPLNWAGCLWLLLALAGGTAFLCWKNSHRVEPFL